MSHQTHQRRRNQAFRVEFLESRRLLSKTITGTIHGTLGGFNPGPGLIGAVANFSSHGKLKHFSDSSKFAGEVRFNVSGNGKQIAFESEGLPYIQDTTPTKLGDKIYFDFKGTGTEKTKKVWHFSWKGDVFGGAGI